MALIRVTAAQLRAQAEALENTNRSFKDQVSSLENQEASLNQMWDGEANDAFHNAFMRDKILMDSFFNAIQNYVHVLEDIAAEYEKAEATNTEIASTRSY